MEGNQNPPAKQAEAKPTSALKDEFVYGEAGPKMKPVMKIGNGWATGLTGFLAGIIVASIILVPWLFILGKLCPISTPR